jgi:hypothetical protein
MTADSLLLIDEKILSRGAFKPFAVNTSE